MHILYIVSVLIGFLLVRIFLRYRNDRKLVKYDWLTIKSCFRPFTLICISITILLVSGLMLFNEYRTSNTLDTVGLAVWTGIMASAIVTLFVEIGNNYRNNAKREAALFEYIAEIKLLNLYLKSKKQKNDFDEVKFVWIHLPGLMKALDVAYKQHSEWLTPDEQFCIRNIMFAYNEIKYYCKLYLEKEFGISSKNVTNNVLPLDLYKKLPHQIQENIAFNDTEVYMDKMVENIFFADNWQDFSFKHPTVYHGNYYIGNPSKDSCSENLLSEQCLRIWKLMECLLRRADNERSVVWIE